MNKKELAKRYILFVVSLFFAALGVAVTKRGELGTSPISSVANVMSGRFEGMTMGVWLIVWNCLLILGQVLLLRRQPGRQVRQAGYLRNDGVDGQQGQQRHSDVQNACAAANDEGFGVEHLGDVPLGGSQGPENADLLGALHYGDVGDDADHDAGRHQGDGHKGDEHIGFDNVIQLQH